MDRSWQLGLEMHGGPSQSPNSCPCWVWRNGRESFEPVAHGPGHECGGSAILIDQVERAQKCPLSSASSPGRQGTSCSLCALHSRKEEAVGKVLLTAREGVFASVEVLMCARVRCEFTPVCARSPAALGSSRRSTTLAVLRPASLCSERLQVMVERRCWAQDCA